MISEVLGTPLQLYFHGSVYDPSSWAGHLSEVKTCNGRLHHFCLGFLWKSQVSLAFDLFSSDVVSVLSSLFWSDWNFGLAWELC